MTALNLQFTQQELADSQHSDYDVIPAGVYMAEIIRSEVKDNRSGTGNRLALGFKILQGDFAGRMVFEDITLSNVNQTAQAIGRKNMAQIARACGLLNIGESSQLHGIPMEIKVAIQKDKTGEYDDRNIIKKYAPLSNQSAGFTAPQPPPAYGQPQGQPPQPQPTVAPVAPVAPVAQAPVNPVAQPPQVQPPQETQQAQTQQAPYPQVGQPQQQAQASVAPTEQAAAPQNFGNQPVWARG